MLRQQTPEELAKVLDSRYVIAQLLATDGDAEAANAELRTVRPLQVGAYGEGSAQVHTLDKRPRDCLPQGRREPCPGGGRNAEGKALAVGRVPDQDHPVSGCRLDAGAAVRVGKRRLPPVHASAILSNIRSDSDAL
jgi:hypothetical protein